MVFGRLYDNEADTIQIVRPAGEADSVCTLIFTDVNGGVIDHVVMTSDEWKITSNVSQYANVQFGFSFARQDGYIKNSEIGTGQFLPALKPDDFVPVAPDQQTNLDYLIGHGFTGSKLNGNSIEFYNMNGDKVVSFDLSPFMQAQSDLGEEDETAETFVKGKKTSNLENDSGFITKTVNDLDNYYIKQDTYSRGQVDDRIQNEIANVNSTRVRNKEPNLVIEVTSDNVQTIATKYIVDNYGRQPQEYDGLYLTFTDHENQVVEYAFHNNAWVSTGFDKVDLSNYMDLVSEQRAKGRKVFEDEVYFEKPVDFDLGVRLNDSEMITTNTEDDSVVKYGATGIEFEKGGDTKQYKQTFQEKSGSIALLEQTVNSVLKHSQVKNIDSVSQKEDNWTTSDPDTIMSITHENETTNTSVSVQKGFAEMSAFGVGEDASNSSVSVTTDTILLTSAEARTADSKYTTLAVTPDGAKINDEKVILQNTLDTKMTEVSNSLKDKLNILGLGESNRVYTRGTENQDSSLPYTYTAEGNSIVYRNAAGKTQVETPTQPEDAVNKAYADKFEQKYLSLTGESGTLDDSQYALVTGYDNLIIQRVGIQFVRCGYPSNGQGNYTFVSPYWAKPNGTEEWADYYITIKQDKTWEATIKNHISVSEQTYPDVIELTPSSATNGTLSDDNFDLLTNHYDIRIKLNNELYDFADDQSTTGVVSYVHTGWNGTAHQDKSINITLSTKAWTLKVGGTNTFEHIIKVSGNNDDSSDAFEFMFLFTSGKSTPVTTQSDLMNLIGTDTQLPVSGWRKTGGVYYPVLYIKGGNAYYYLNSTTGPALAGVASLGNYSITDEVK